MGTTKHANRNAASGRKHQSQPERHDHVMVEVEVNGHHYRVPAHKVRKFRQQMLDASRSQCRQAKGRKVQRRSMTANQWAANPYGEGR